MTTDTAERPRRRTRAWTHEPADPDAPLLTVPQAARLAGVTVRTIGRWIACGVLKKWRPPNAGGRTGKPFRATRVRRHDVERLLGR